MFGQFQETHKITTIIWWFRHLPLAKSSPTLYFLGMMYSSKLNPLRFATFQPLLFINSQNGYFLRSYFG